MSHGEATWIQSIYIPEGQSTPYSLPPALHSLLLLTSGTPHGCFRSEAGSCFKMHIDWHLISSWWAASGQSPALQHLPRNQGPFSPNAQLHASSQQPLAAMADGGPSRAAGEVVPPQEAVVEGVVQVGLAPWHAGIKQHAARP